MSESSPPSERPTRLKDDRYHVQALLGEGSQGSTFSAYDAERDEQVAIKQFRVRGASSWKDVELAEREARVLASLSHPLIPAYVDHFEERGELFLVTELIDGTSLAELIRRGTLTETDIVSLLHDLARVLGYLHGRSPPVIHRDIKPGNVLRRKDGRYVLTDFGAVRDKMRPTGGSTVVGTFGYMAPEQFQGRALPASDVYGAAATVMTALTRSEPESLPHRGLAIDVHDALKEHKGRTARELERILARALEPDPDKRAKSLGSLLGGLAADTEPRTEPPERPRRRKDKKKRKRQQPPRNIERERRRAERDREKLAGFLVVLLVIGLTIGQLAVLLACNLIVPAILYALSPIIHPGLRRAARQVFDAGIRARSAMDRAKEYVRGEQSEISGRDQEATRVRIAADDVLGKVEDEIEAGVDKEVLFEMERDAEEAARSEAEAYRRRRDRARRQNH